MSGSTTVRRGVPQGRFAIGLFILLVLSGFVLMYFDSRIQEPFEDILTKYVDDNFIGLHFFRYFGGPQTTILACLLIWTLGAKNKRKLLLPYVVCLGIIGGFTDIAKDVIGRARPNKFDRQLVFYPFPTAFTDDKASTSLPSGHATGAFANATFLSAMYPPAAPIFYTLAVGTALHRVEEGRHFSSDVVFGAVFGIYLSLALQRLLRRRFGIEFHPENPDAAALGGTASP
ncbi:MAG: phosphatase PAP2 family protein [Candidatus Sumerlaeia bacterium]|nr:phosphatase PAP2 family protein [Candidatus Sumerlaeia bacterium]